MAVNALPALAHAAHPHDCNITTLTSKSYGTNGVITVEVQRDTCTGQLYGTVYSGGYYSTSKVILYGCSDGYGCSPLTEGDGGYNYGVSTSPGYTVYGCQPVYAYGWMGSYSGGTDVITVCP